ncbi:hypothetical protein [Streptomyces aureoverticillatus]|uniref:hypothetical protein n=1 Tax=Streptomyces aureoverticillatus TaxID=66871 RepID=UPI0013DA610A|nr:hypothetical protein [Streptomyces aureoverticillatus]QIB43015.1 hypothetical protein G3H79_07980 [Streptomyces aureoverticillatus]
MDILNDADVRTILEPHQDGGLISRLCETGEITEKEKTVQALGLLARDVLYSGDEHTAARLLNVAEYVSVTGERPPVPNWTTR